jgi:hypothetical protein
VGHLPVPASSTDFPLFRAAGLPDSFGKVTHWWIWDGEKEWRIPELTTELRKLPIRMICNDISLIEKIETGWTPLADPR